MKRLLFVALLVLLVLGMSGAALALRSGEASATGVRLVLPERR